MTSTDPQDQKLKALFAVDPLRPIEQLDPAGKLVSPDRFSLLVLLVCEVPEESLILFRKQLVPPKQLGRQVAAREVELKRHLAEITQKLESMGYEVEGRVERGKQTGVVITEVADQDDVDLIILQRRRQKPWQRVLVGSVADYLTRHTTRPLVIMPYA
ncbi:universal stress protein [Marinobacter sp. CHS3-4]|uniref:universal stress protein n=1 Tax=Marinobacter sp. CHS3-4 TaxID=3045174 RepID=UPI0024B5333C|nr:universal stress protein [Marinobacter sp. CHS3-4]MDI9244678.1 universal stress protein [Marinobacter sp. CHS3-4]